MDCLSTEKPCIIFIENHITLKVLFWNYFDWYYVNHLLGSVTTYRNPNWEHNPTTFCVSENSVQVIEDFHHQTISATTVWVSGEKHKSSCSSTPHWKAALDFLWCTHGTEDRNKKLNETITHPNQLQHNLLRVLLLQLSRDRTLLEVLN